MQQIKYSFPQLCGLLQEPSDPAVTGVASNAIKTTELGSCNGTVCLILQNSYVSNNSLNEDDNFLPCRCTRKLSNKHKTFCHEIKAYPNLRNLSLNHFNDYFRVGGQKQNNRAAQEVISKELKNDKLNFEAVYSLCMHLSQVK